MVFANFCQMNHVLLPRVSTLEGAPMQDQPTNAAVFKDTKEINAKKNKVIILFKIFILYIDKLLLFGLLSLSSACYQSMSFSAA